MMVEIIGSQMSAHCILEYRYIFHNLTGVCLVLEESLEIIQILIRTDLTFDIWVDISWTTILTKLSFYYIVFY